MIKSIIIGFALMLCISCTPKEAVIELSTSDKAAIKKLAREIPLILSNEGWQAYESKFALEYQNWSMIGDKVRSREEYLKLVKDWYDAGNRAEANEVESVDFIPLDTDRVMYLYSQKETFNDPSDSTRIIRMMSIFVKEEDWKYQFTAFMDKP